MTLNSAERPRYFLFRLQDNVYCLCQVYSENLTLGKAECRREFAVCSSRATQ